MVLSIIFNKLNPLITSSEIDKSALSNIVSLAEKKRQEELDILYDAVLDHIGELQEKMTDKLLEVARLQMDFIHDHSSSIASLTEQIEALEKEIELYKKKLETIAAERNGGA